MNRNHYLPQFFITSSPHHFITDRLIAVLTDCPLQKKLLYSIPVDYQQKTGSQAARQDQLEEDPRRFGLIGQEPAEG